MSSFLVSYQQGVSKKLGQEHGYVMLIICLKNNKKQTLRVFHNYVPARHGNNMQSSGRTV